MAMYNVCFSVTGAYDVTVAAISENEARDIACQKWSDEDFGALHNIDAEIINVEMISEENIKHQSVINWIPVSECCPEEDDGEWLVILKSGRVSLASYLADEDGDYWRCLEIDESDTFFTTDPVVEWAELPYHTQK